MFYTRRHFLSQLGWTTAGLSAVSTAPSLAANLWSLSDSKDLFFKISLAEFSLASPLYAGKMTNLEFPEMAKKDFGISNVEYVSGFWQDKAEDQSYLKQLKQRTDDLGVRNVLIMVDAEGELGSPNDTERTKAVENHYKWVNAAKFLGCHAIRVNLSGKGSDDDVAQAGIDGYGRLVEYGMQNNISIIIENHFGPSTDPDWLVHILKQVDSPFAGALPDFGNFTRRTDMEEMTLEAFAKTKVIKEFDKYDGVAKLMPYAKGISAKTHQFNNQGEDTETDFPRILKIIKDAGFTGYIGIEYEGAFLKAMMNLPGNYLTEYEGIMATKRLLEKYGAS